MADLEPKTPNLGLPLRTAGHVPTQRALKEGFTKIDEAYADLLERVEALEAESPST